MGLIEFTSVYFFFLQEAEKRSWWCMFMFGAASHHFTGAEEIEQAGGEHEDVGL